MELRAEKRALASWRENGYFRAHGFKFYGGRSGYVIACGRAPRLSRPEVIDLWDDNHPVM